MDPAIATSIAGSDILTLTFTNTLSSTLIDITLHGVATLFNSGHTPFGAGFATPLDVKDASKHSISAVCEWWRFQPGKFCRCEQTQPNLTGHTFAFEQYTGSPEFYVSALSYCYIGCSSQRENTAARRPPALCHWSQRVRSARLAREEAEESSGNDRGLNTRHRLRKLEDRREAVFLFVAVSEFGCGSKRTLPLINAMGGSVQILSQCASRPATSSRCKSDVTTE